VLALAAAAAAIAVAVSGGGSGDGRWHQTFDTTSGPHVAVVGLPGVDLAPLREIPGLTATSGPFPVVDTSLEYRGREVGTRLEGRPVAATAVDHPLVVSGRWVRPGTVVLERKTAQSLHARLGARVIVGSARGRVHLTVGGVAETAAPTRGVGNAGGLGYVAPITMTGVAPKATYGSRMLLRLSDPGQAGRYVDWITRRYPGRQVTVEEPSPSR
jgi:putative ABC transport system permease protein